MTRGLSDLEQYRNRDRNAVMEKARQVVEDEIARSNAFEEAAVESLSRFAPEEIGMGRVVGRGGFCVVRECTSIRLIASQQPSSPGGKGADSPDHSARDAADVVNTSHQRFQHSSSLAEDSKRSALAFTRAATPTRSRLTEALFSNLSSSNHETERRRQRGFVSRNVESFASAPASVESESSREQLARRVWSKKSHRRYVVKKVEPELYHQDRVTYLRGVIDLALETYYLASLSSHPHILAIRGVSASGSFEAGYFIVLDRLEDVLSKRLTAWMHQDRATRGLTGAFTGGRRKVKDLLTERILVSIDIVSAMEYLHSRNIIYRDLKPDNVGFDAEGSVKVFDFGLARQLHDDERGEDGLYHMTGFTGGIRYMSPEVRESCCTYQLHYRLPMRKHHSHSASISFLSYFTVVSFLEVGLREPYNLKADVYSWSMLMWYIMALEPPFGLFTPRMFLDRVFKRGYRPAVKEKWPSGINRLMKMCWSAKIVDRPDFSQIKDLLRKELMLIDPHTTSFLAEE